MQTIFVQVIKWFEFLFQIFFRYSSQRIALLQQYSNEVNILLLIHIIWLVSLLTKRKMHRNAEKGRSLCESQGQEATGPFQLLNLILHQAVSRIRRNERGYQDYSM